jgi:hypothetical protein
MTPSERYVGKPSYVHAVPEPGDCPFYSDYAALHADKEIFPIKLGLPAGHYLGSAPIEAERFCETRLPRVRDAHDHYPRCTIRARAPNARMLALQPRC